MWRTWVIYPKETTNIQIKSRPTTARHPRVNRHRHLAGKAPPVVGSPAALSSGEHLHGVVRSNPALVRRPQEFQAQLGKEPAPVHLAVLVVVDPDHLEGAGVVAENTVQQVPGGGGGIAVDADPRVGDRVHGGEGCRAAVGPAVALADLGLAHHAPPGSDIDDAVLSEQI